MLDLILESCLELVLVVILLKIVCVLHSNWERKLVKRWRRGGDRNKRGLNKSKRTPDLLPLSETNDAKAGLDKVLPWPSGSDFEGNTRRAIVCNSQGGGDLSIWCCLTPCKWIVKQTKTA